MPRICHSEERSDVGISWYIVKNLTAAAGDCHALRARNDSAGRFLVRMLQKSIICIYTQTVEKSSRDTQFGVSLQMLHMDYSLPSKQ